MKRTEISQGLYPRAPELRRGTDLTPAEQFWIVKHGVTREPIACWLLALSGHGFFPKPYRDQEIISALQPFCRLGTKTPRLRLFL
jgi:hypothetical protein